MSLLETLDAYADTIRAIRHLHRADPAGYCRECTVKWPCRTHKLTDMDIFE